MMAFYVHGVVLVNMYFLFLVRWKFVWYQVLVKSLRILLVANILAFTLMLIDFDVKDMASYLV